MLRTVVATVIVVAGILGLGADLAHTAYAAAQTARVVVLPSARA